MPIEDKITGTEAPIAIPIKIGKAIENVITPVLDKACKIPTAADAD